VKWLIQVVEKRLLALRELSQETADWLFTCFSTLALSSSHESSLPHIWARHFTSKTRSKNNCARVRGPMRIRWRICKAFNIMTHYHGRRRCQRQGVCTHGPGPWAPSLRQIAACTDKWAHAIEDFTSRRQNGSFVKTRLRAEKDVFIARRNYSESSKQFLNNFKNH